MPSEEKVMEAVMDMPLLDLEGHLRKFSFLYFISVSHIFIFLHSPGTKFVAHELI